MQNLTKAWIRVLTQQQSGNESADVVGRTSLSDLKHGETRSFSPLRALGEAVDQADDRKHHDSLDSLPIPSHKICSICYDEQGLQAARQQDHFSKDVAATRPFWLHSVLSEDICAAKDYTKHPRTSKLL